MRIAFVMLALAGASAAALSACSSMAANPHVAAPASEASHQQFEQQVKAAVDPLAGKEIVGLKVVYVSGDVGPWLDTGMALDNGDKVTLVLSGRILLSRTYNLSFEAPIAVWAKIAEAGPIFRSERETNTFTANAAGTLRLKPYPGQRWVNPTGKYLGDPAPINPDSGGGVSVAIIRWAASVNVAEQLQRVAKQDARATWADAEVARLQQTDVRKPPADWYYLWELGTSQVYAEVTPQAAPDAPKRAIDLHTRNDVAILQKDTSFELTPNTKLLWKWKADKLPAKVAENSLPTHDYMSIAVEFDNGRDITFFWSANLPVGMSFHCPLPGWDHRETHIVARSGTADLGKWLNEDMNVFEHYRKAVGGEMPKRITRVWLIAVSLFQKTEGMSQFSDIVLSDGAAEARVY